MPRPSPVIVSDRQVSRKVLLADAIHNTQIRFKCKPSKINKVSSSSHHKGRRIHNQSYTTQEFVSQRESPGHGSESLAAIQSASNNNNNSNAIPPFEVGKNDLKAFAKYGVLNQHDMAKSMPTFEDKSKSKNAALYEKKRYLEMLRIKE